MDVVIYNEIVFTSRSALIVEPPVNLRSLTLGIETKIGYGSIISGPSNFRGLQSCGRFCSIGPNVTIGLGNHPTNWLSTHSFQYAPFYLPSGTIQNFRSNYKFFDGKDFCTVGNDVWIGANVIILKGVSIPDGVIVGSGAVVTKSPPPYSIIAGNPAKVIKLRFEESIICKLLKIAWWKYDITQAKGLNFSDINQCIDYFDSHTLPVLSPP